MPIRRSTIWLLSASLLAATPLPAEEGPPPARRVEHIDSYHGVAVPDPYRWLEDMESDETRAWIRAQDTWARRWIAGGEGRDEIRERIRKVADITRFGVPTLTPNGLFYLEGDAGFQRLAVIHHRQGQAPRTLVDPDAVAAADGDDAHVTRFVASPDGQRVAYAIAHGGSSWERWRVRVVASGKDTREELTGISSRASLVRWAPDGSGLYYERFEEPEAGGELTHLLEGERLFFHRLGTEQTADLLIYDPGSKTVGLNASVSTDGRYLVLVVSEQGDPNNRLLVRDLTSDPPGWTALIPEADAIYRFVGNDGPTFWLYTNDHAPRGRVISVDLRAPGREAWKDLVPEADDTIDTWIGARAVGDRLVVGYRKDAWLAVRVFAADGRPAYDLELPKVGSIWSFSGRQGDSEAFFTLSDFTDPGTVYRLDVASGRISVFRRPKLAYDPEGFVTRQVFYTSKDGTRIPMFVTHRRGLRLDGSNPAFLYGYGAFNWAASPWFQPQVTVWLQMGGVYALPNLRGGGEYGEPWHQAGIGRNKQTSIDDFLAAAEWLIANRYTSRGRLVVNGGSASGPLVGAVITQRPELFAASLIDFPALDMLRLEGFTGGRRWRTEFGTVEDPQGFRALLAYSPYHNVKQGTCYPATLIAPGERDETTVPMHAYKFAAALQRAQGCDHPILLRVSWGAGHSYGATNEDSMDTWADQLAFLVRVLGLESPSVPGPDRRELPEAGEPVLRAEPAAGR